MGLPNKERQGQPPSVPSLWRGGRVPALQLEVCGARSWRFPWVGQPQTQLLVLLGWGWLLKSDFHGTTHRSYPGSVWRRALSLHKYTWRCPLPCCDWAWVSVVQAPGHHGELRFSGPSMLRSYSSFFCWILRLVSSRLVLKSRQFTSEPPGAGVVKRCPYVHT